MQQLGVNSCQIILSPRYIADYSRPHDLDDGILSLGEPTRKYAVVKKEDRGPFSQKHLKKGGEEKTDSIR
jgi:hypothetical protein